jgi:hypothetical protein
MSFNLNSFRRNNKMKRNIALIFGIALISPIQAMAADTASWANWASSSSGSFIQNSNTINVTYSGSTFGVDYNSYIYDVPSSFTNTAVTNTPGTNGTILMSGGTLQVNNFYFSQAVINPLMDVFSVGQSGVPVSFNFLNGATFSILSSGAGHWGGGTLTQSGNSIIGVEGNGLLQFNGSYTDISFTTPNYEYYYGATVGALSAPVPEPETYAMLLAGLGLLGFTARRRKDFSA